MAAGKLHMSQQGGHCAIILAHYFIALAQRLFVIFGSKSLTKVGDNRGIANVSGALASLEHLDAPVVVGAEAIVKVVMWT